MRKYTANKTFDDIDKIETVITNGVITLQNDKERVKQLTCWDWIEEQVLSVLKY